MSKAKKDVIPQSVAQFMNEASDYIGRQEAESSHFDMWCLFHDTPIESPIEQLFYSALMAVCKVSSFEDHTLVGVSLPDRWPEPKECGGHVFCFPQAPIGKYRADYVLFACDGPHPTPVVVEIDGHDWHDRDEKQRRYEKRRDRFMQSKGFKVARYTGSEVHADPYAAATDALNLSVGSDDEFVTPKELWGD